MVIRSPTAHTTTCQHVIARKLSRRNYLSCGVCLENELHNKRLKTPPYGDTTAAIRLWLLSVESESESAEQKTRARAVHYKIRNTEKYEATTIYKINCMYVNPWHCFFKKKKKNTEQQQLQQQKRPLAAQQNGKEQNGTPGWNVCQWVENASYFLK